MASPPSASNPRKERKRPQRDELENSCQQSQELRINNQEFKAFTVTIGQTNKAKPHWSKTASHPLNIGWELTSGTCFTNWNQRIPDQRLSAALWLFVNRMPIDRTSNICGTLSKWIGIAETPCQAAWNGHKKAFYCWLPHLQMELRRVPVLGCLGC
jgi:hypothetical protein